MKRQMTKEEEHKFEWVEVTTVSDKSPVFAKSIMRSEVPPMPDDGFVYELKDGTKFGDDRRMYEWVPVMVEE